MDNSNKLGLINALRSNPDNQSYLNLIAYLESRLVVIQTEMIDASGIEEISKLQGRAREVKDFLAGLKRRPVQTQQYSGSFN